MLVHVFIGSRLAALAEDENMSLGAKAVNWMSMIVGGGIGAAVGLIIYRRTMARAAELAREDAMAGGAAEQGDAGYEDAEASTLMDPDDAAELMSDDDMSLWDTQVDDYRDDDGEGVQDDDDGVKKQKTQNGNGTKHDDSDGL